jgi:hypothetical protein
MFQQACWAFEEVQMDQHIHTSRNHVFCIYNQRVASCITFQDQVPVSDCVVVLFIQANIAATCAVRKNWFNTANNARASAFRGTKGVSDFQW